MELSYQRFSLRDFPLISNASNIEAHLIGSESLTIVMHARNGFERDRLHVIFTYKLFTSAGNAILLQLYSAVFAIFFYLVYAL